MVKGRRFIDLSYVFQQLADGCKVCKKEITGPHEDETVIITYLLYDMIHVVSFRKTTLISTIGTHKEIIIKGA